MDPFLLPHPSTSRLVLLVLTLAAGSAFAAHWVLVLERNSWRERNLRCVSRLAESASDPAVAVATFDRCLSAITRDQALATFGGPLLLAVAAVAGWLVSPWLVALRNRVRPVRDKLGLGAALGELVAEAGLTDSHRPEFVVATRHQGDVDAWTYGRRGHYRVALGAELLPSFVSNPVVFRAKVRHELAHLRNRDVDRTYLALSAWYAFMLLTAVELARTMVLASEPMVGIVVGARLLALALLVYLSLAGFLRARELDADLRAAAMPAGWKDMATALPGDGDGDGDHTTTNNGALAAGFRRHPPPRRRGAAVRRPELVMSLRVAEVAGAGIGAGLVFGEVQQAVNGLLGNRLLLSVWISGLLLAIPVTGVVGAATWRHCLVAHAGRGAFPAFVAPGLALGAGLLAGNELSARASTVWKAVRTSSAWFDTPTLSDANLGPALLLVAATLAGGVLATGWIAYGAHAWSRRSTTSRRRASLALAGQVTVGAVVLAVPLTCWFLALAGLPSGSSPAVLASWYERPALRNTVAATVALALAYVAAGRIWSGRPFTTVAGMRRGVLIIVAAFAVLSCLVALVPRTASPAVSLAAVATGMPTTKQGFFACSWADQNDWAPLVAARSDPTARRAFGDYLASTDDPAMRVIGEAYLSTLDTTDSAATEDATTKAAATALLRLCDVEQRYGRPDKANLFE